MKIDVVLRNRLWFLPYGDKLIAVMARTESEAYALIQEANPSTLLFSLEQRLRDAIFSA